MRATAVLCLCVIAMSMVMVSGYREWTENEIIETGKPKPNVGCHLELGGLINAESQNNASATGCYAFHFAWQQTTQPRVDFKAKNPACFDVNGGQNPGPFGGPNGKPSVTYDKLNGGLTYFTTGYGENLYMWQTPSGLVQLYARLPDGHDYVVGLELVSKILYLITTKQIFYSTPQGFNKPQTWFPLEIPFGNDISLGSGTEVTSDGVDRFIMTGTRNSLYFYNITSRVRLNTITLSRPAGGNLYTPGSQLFYSATFGVLISSKSDTPGYEALYRLTQAQLAVSDGVLSVMDNLLLGTGPATFTTGNVWFQLSSTSGTLLIWDLNKPRSVAKERQFGVNATNAKALAAQVIGNLVFFA